MEINVDNYKFPSANRCIYCGRTDSALTDEHIIAFALGGRWVLPNASCNDCQKQTQKIEEICLNERGGMFAAMRSLVGLPSRSGWTKKKTVKTDMTDADGSNIQNITMDVDKMPVAAFGARLPVAAMLRGVTPEERPNIAFVLKMFDQQTIRLPSQKNVRFGRFHFNEFFRMLIKIGYSFAAAQSIENLLPEVSDVILGKRHDALNYLGGDWIGNDEETAQYGHRIEIVHGAARGDHFTIVQIHLFGQFGLPKYHVVVGKRPLDGD